ncbi:MAG: Crp/Fnr family transcriptional regulator [Clostridia bacterium]|nr:Crp/Fnr family transcriptional regulator [Clostridia bacterium]
MFSDQDISRIFGHAFLSGIDRENALSIWRTHACEITAFEDGDVIHSPDSSEKKVGLILDGRAVVTTKDPSKTALLRYLGVGDAFGVANLFNDEPYVSVIRAEKKCRVFFMNERAVRAMLESDRVFLYRYLTFLSGRVCYLNRKIGYLTAGSAERRLALYLCSFEKAEISLENSLSSLSELLDVGRASLYRAFDRLIADGHIQKDGRKILLLDPAALRSAYQ